MGGGDAAIDAARKEIRVHLGRFQHWSYSDAANLALFAAQHLQADRDAEIDMLTLLEAFNSRAEALGKPGMSLSDITVAVHQCATVSNLFRVDRRRPWTVWGQALPKKSSGHLQSDDHTPHCDDKESHRTCGPESSTAPAPSPASPSTRPPTGDSGS